MGMKAVVIFTLLLLAALTAAQGSVCLFVCFYVPSTLCSKANDFSMRKLFKPLVLDSKCLFMTKEKIETGWTTL